MKKILLITIVLCTFLNKKSHAQTINWARTYESQNNIAAFFGWDYGLAGGLTYGHQLKTKMPIILHAEGTLPTGKHVFDDYKLKIGGQANLYKLKNFYFNTRIDAVFRRFENPMARFTNFGSDLSLIIGYYKTKWFIAGEMGFDKAIVTKFKHMARYKEIFPGVQDGWYEPSTGGNIYYGLQAGYSLKQCDLTLKIGKVVTQDFKTTPTIPFYGQLGLNFRFTKK